MATCIMILLWVNDELRFDRFRDKGDHLYRIICSDLWSGERFWFAETPAPLAPALKEEFPEIINSTRYNRTRNVLFKQSETKFVKEIEGMADPSFLEMFTFPMIKGDPKSALDNPDSVIRDVPRQSHIQFSMLIPFEYLEELDRSLDSWGRFSYYTYIELHPESAGISEERLTTHYQSHFTELENIALKNFPVAKIHHYGGTMGGIGADGNITNVYIFSAVALIVLLIANLFAWPAAYFIMDVWLGTFAYQTNIQIWIFLGSAVLALVIALLTVSFQAIKAALSNPVTSLRYE
jgi:putative ABC transport system permease protein